MPGLRLRHGKHDQDYQSSFRADNFSKFFTASEIANKIAEFSEIRNGKISRIRPTSLLSSCSAPSSNRNTVFFIPSPLSPSFYYTITYKILRISSIVRKLKTISESNNNRIKIMFRTRF